MSNPDQIQRFLFDDTQVRGVVTGLQQSYQAILARDSYPRPVQLLLGEMMAACAAISTMMKFDGRLSIQARGEGALSIIQAECDNQADIRAIARWQGDISDELPPLQLLAEGGRMAITIEPANGKRYQGVVALEGDTLAACLEGYFSRSEQLPTRFYLTADGKDAAAVMLQALPEQSHQSSEEYQEDWARLTTLADTLTAEEMLGLDNETLLTRLYHEETVRTFPAIDLRFYCDCSKERCGAALATLARQELDEIFEDEPLIRVHCQFCNEEYCFDQADVETLFNPNASQGDPGVLH